MHIEYSSTNSSELKTPPLALLKTFDKLKKEAGERERVLNGWNSTDKFQYFKRSICFCPTNCNN